MLTNYFKEHELSEIKNISMNVFQDYQENLVIAISGQRLLPKLLTKLTEAVEELNGNIDSQIDDEINYHIISLPNYLLKS